MEDLRFITKDAAFQYKGAGIIIENGHLLMATNDAAHYYYPVGGAVRFGEKAHDAAIREIYEETGLQYEIGRLAFVCEKTLTDKTVNNGSLAHEIALYFLMKPKGFMAEIKSDSYGFCGNKERFEWLSLDELGKHKLYPEFFVNKLNNISEDIEHIVAFI